MPKPTQDQIDEELKKQDDEVYGTDYTDGGEKFHDTEEMVKEVIGEEPEDGKPFSVADAVEEDEEAIEDGADNVGYPGDVDEDDVESELEKLEKERDKDTSSDE